MFGKSIGLSRDLDQELGRPRDRKGGRAARKWGMSSPVFIASFRCLIRLLDHPVIWDKNWGDLFDGILTGEIESTKCIRFLLSLLFKILSYMMNVSL